MRISEKITAVLRDKNGNIKQQNVKEDLITTVGWDYLCDKVGNTSTTVTGESVGTGDGSTVTFSLANEATFDVVGKVDGVAKGLVSVNNRDGTMTFETAPASGTSITADYKYWSEGWKTDYIAIGSGTTPPNVSDTALESEITTGGGARAQVTYAHVAGTKVWSISNVFTFTASLSINEVGVFNASSGGTMLSRQLFPTTFNASSGDTLTVEVIYTLED